MHLDAKLYPHLHSLPTLPFSRLIKPTAASKRQARKAFFKTGALPIFEYPKTNTVQTSELLKAIQTAKSRINHSPAPLALKQIYTNKLDELKIRTNLIIAIANGDDRLVSSLSLKLYGRPDTDLRAFEAEFANRLERIQAGEVHHHDKHIKAEKFCQLLERSLKHYGVPNWKIKISARKRLKCSHNHKTASIVLWVPKKLNISQTRAQRLIAHEVEVHALRRLNGANSPLHILKHGLAGYAKTEEGLALYHQHSLDAPRKHAPGFWDAWTSTLMHQLGFKGAFDELHKAQIAIRTARHEPDANKQAKATAWNLCLRASKGIAKPGKPGIGYFRDHIYRQGYLELVQAVQTYGEANILPALFVGKAGLTDLDNLKDFKLKPSQLPDIHKHKTTR